MSQTMMEKLMGHFLMMEISMTPSEDVICWLLATFAKCGMHFF